MKNNSMQNASACFCLGVHDALTGNRESADILLNLGTIFLGLDPALPVIGNDNLKRGGYGYYAANPS